VRLPTQVLAFDPVAQLLYSGHHDGSLTLWDCSRVT